MLKQVGPQVMDDLKDSANVCEVNRQVPLHNSNLESKREKRWRIIFLSTRK